MRTIPISKKLMYSTAFLGFLIALLCLQMLTSIAAVKADFDLAVDRTAKALSLVGHLSNDLANLRTADAAFLLYAHSKDADAMKGAETRFYKAMDLTRRHLADLQPLLTAEDKTLAEGIAQDLSNLETGKQEVIKIFDEAGATEATRASNQKNRPVFGHAQEATDRVWASQERLFQDQKITAAKRQSTTRWTVAIIATLAMLGIGGMIWVVRQIVNQLKEVVERMSEGARQVSNAASQASSTSQALAQGTSENAASLQETSAATLQISSMTRKNADNSRDAAQAANETELEFTAADQKLAEMVESMHQINGSSEKISKIIKAIDEIAFQTNILALNAAVEAARAGEAGMGFAVVADEVRNLAQRCAQAANDTTVLIEESISNTQQGSHKLSVVETAIKTISNRSRQIKVLVDEVRSGSEEQARGLDQITRSIAQMEQGTQRTAASAEESAAGSEELNAHSESLKDVVLQLNTLLGR